jgi:hypothetical protein
MADAAVPPQGLTKYPEIDRAVVKAEMEQARQDFHRLLNDATGTDLRRLSDGTNQMDQSAATVPGTRSSPAT